MSSNNLNLMSYPYARQFSKSIGIPVSNLIEAFHIEREFHSAVLKEQSFEARKILYRDVYRTVHPIYGKTASFIAEGKNPKDRTVRLFRNELSGKSVLDIGCGEGYFLASIARNLEHGRLVGIDVSIPSATKQIPGIEFVSDDIIDFQLDYEFDAVFSDQVLEHIASVDMDMHLASINRALRTNGTFIVLLPNRLFGPSDVTRVIDFTYSGCTPAQGTHLNEMSFGETIQALQAHGFGYFKTILPFRKVKHILPFVRIRPSLFTAIERNPTAMRLIRALRIRRQCFFRFEVALICKKV